jgi:hypothetical protein
VAVGEFCRFEAVEHDYAWGSRDPNNNDLTVAGLENLTDLACPADAVNILMTLYVSDSNCHVGPLALGE